MSSVQPNPLTERQQARSKSGVFKVIGNRLDKYSRLVDR
jgi:hypothetical protein